ncbi:hypothetical protein BDV12DRAFT_109635 [Aspergillus spectabilis]
MPSFFRKREKKPSLSSAAFRSVEHLPHPPSSSSAPHFDSDDSSSNNNNNNNNTNANNFYHLPVSTSQQFPPQTQPQSHSQSQSQSQFHSSPDPNHPPARHPARTSLQRSHTQRLRTPPDASTLSHSASTVTVVNNSPSAHLAPPQSFDADVSDQSWPSSPTDKPDDQEPRRSKRSLFSFHSSTSSSSVRDQPSLLERNRSVKRTSVSTRRQSEQQQQQQQRQQQPPQPDKSRSSVDTWSRDYAVDGPEAEHRSPMPQQSTGRAPDPGLAPHTHSPHPLPNPSPLPRSNTDPHLIDQVYRQPLVDNSRHADLAPTTHQLDPRPPSRQSVGPPSPFPPPKSETSSVSHLGAMSDRPSGGTQQNQSQPPTAAHGSSQETGFRTAGQQQNALDTGRATPTSKDNRSRDDLSDADVRGLLQKLDELQAKYSKVKRYYFERDAQVQQLQNTVAHQRMAISRTVLDDNEYANRFGRLDGAIKDLAFSIRKDWKTIPPWLTGFVNEDAPTTGTKEMTAIGRAVMSRWLVDELFERYFHPVLEPAFSQQLKSIEMTLRRQQTNTCTEEDKENSIARISNWRRTTLDGLGDFLQGPAADDYRADLINRLVDNLVATLVNNLHDPPPPGVDNGARMIVENAVGIAEKIPLESRDVCVDYILPGSPIHDATMKIEAGVLPPLTSAIPPDTRRSADHAPEHNHPDEENGTGEPDRDSPANPTSNPGLDSAPVGREQRMRSVFSNIMGRKSGQGQGPPGGSAPTPTNASSVTVDSVRRGSVGVPVPGPAPTGAGQGRIRLAAFITAEVRGRGPMNVLVKAPAYPIE